MKFILEESPSKIKYILNEAIAVPPEDFGIELAFEKLFKQGIHADDDLDLSAYGGVAPKITRRGLAGFAFTKLSLEQAWTAYFEQVWGTSKNIIQNLEPAFSLQLTTLGFTSKTNPFIAFVRTLLTEGIKPSKAAYTAIHNLVSNGVITKDNLLFKSNDSLLWCPHLYTVSSGDAVQTYLTKSVQLLKNLKNDLTNIGKKILKDVNIEHIKGILLSYCFIKQKTKFKPEDSSLEHLKKTIQSDKASFIMLTDSKARLRDLSEIDTILVGIDDSFVGSSSSGSLSISSKAKGGADEVKISSAEIKDAWKQIKDTLGKSKKDICRFLHYIIMSYSRSRSIYEQNSRTINKAIFKISGPLAAVDQIDFINNLDSYSKLITALKINTKNMTDTITLLLDNLPSDLI